MTESSKRLLLNAFPRTPTPSEKNQLRVPQPKYAEDDLQGGEHALSRAVQLAAAVSVRVFAKQVGNRWLVKLHRKWVEGPR